MSGMSMLKLVSASSNKMKGTRRLDLVGEPLIARPKAARLNWLMSSISSALNARWICVWRTDSKTYMIASPFRKMNCSKKSNQTTKVSTGEWRPHLQKRRMMGYLSETKYCGSLCAVVLQIRKTRNPKSRRISKTSLLRANQSVTFQNFSTWNVLYARWFLRIKTCLCSIHKQSIRKLIISL